MSKKRTIDTLLKYNLSFDQISILEFKGYMNGCGGKGGLNFSKLMNKIEGIKYFKNSKLLPLRSDVRRLCSENHDIDFSLGGGFFDFIYANYDFAIKVTKLLHWTSVFGRLFIFILIFIPLSLLGWKYFYWGIKKRLEDLLYLTNSIMKEIKIYNQNSFNDFKNDCVPTSILQILSINYLLNLSYSLFDKFVIFALKMKVLFKTGAKFDVMYNWAPKVVEKRYSKVKLKPYETSIMKKKFEDMLKEGYAFGIGLQHGNSEYLKSVKRGLLNRNDVDLILQGEEDWSHNNVFFYENKRYYIGEVARGKKVECPIEVLRYACEKKMFWSPARTFVPAEDEFTKRLHKYLFRGNLLSKTKYNSKNKELSNNIADNNRKAEECEIKIRNANLDIISLDNKNKELEKEKEALNIAYRLKTANKPLK